VGPVYVWLVLKKTIPLFKPVIICWAKKAKALYGLLKKFAIRGNE
jgi:hypothetical protein